MTASTSMRSGPATSRTVDRRPRRGARSRARRRARACRHRRPPRPDPPAPATRSRRRRPASPGRGRAATCTTHCACARSRARRTCRPRPVPRCIGASWPATDESPTAPGSAKVTNSSHSASWRHRARAPTKRSRLTATSTSARSGSCPGRSTTSAASRTQGMLAGATRGHQAGGDAGHRRLAHLGEDVVGAGGERADRHVAARLGHDAVGAVAAEHGDRGDAPRAHLARRRRVLSAALEVSRTSSSSSAGKGAPPSSARAVRPASWPCSADESPSPAGIISTARRRRRRARRAGGRPSRPCRRCRTPTRRPRAGGCPPGGRVGDDAHTGARGHPLQATPTARPSARRTARGCRGWRSCTRGGTCPA